MDQELSVSLSQAFDSKNILRVENKSGNGIQRARVFFKNGYELSIIRGWASYGGDKGLFEIMPSDSSLFDEQDSGGAGGGNLSEERVVHYINKIGAM